MTCSAKIRSITADGNWCRRNSPYINIKAAIAAADDLRLLSTVLNGNAYDMGAFKADVDSLIPIN